MDKDRALARQKYAELKKGAKAAYLWEYYKWQFLGTLAVLIAIILTVHNCVTRIHPDLTVLYLAEPQHFVTDENIDYLGEWLAELIEDANNDGRQVVTILPSVFDPQPEQIDEMTIALTQRLHLQLVSGEAKLFIVDETFLEMLQGFEIVELYAPITNPPRYIEDIPLYAVVRLVYERDMQGRHAERTMVEHANARTIFRLLTEY